MLHRTPLPLAGLVLLLSCGTESAPFAPSPHGPEITVSSLGGSGQIALRGSVLPSPLRLKVLSLGVPVARAQVAWQPSAGSVAIGSSFTDSSGVATAYWTLGSTPGPMTLTATVAGAEGSPVSYIATALPLITLSADPATDNQEGPAGAQLAQPLRVRVLWEGAPRADLAVRWTTSAGVLPLVSLTDAAGFATAAWKLGGTVGIHHALARVDGATGTVGFTALALPGPPATIVMSSGDGQSFPANYPAFRDLVVTATDSYGNLAAHRPIEWTIVSGPAAFVFLPVETDEIGQSRATVQPTGAPGDIVIRAGAAEGPSVEFTLTALPPVPLAVLEPNTGFVSRMNGTQPAVDTIPAGTAMTWVLHPFDYDDHGIESVGTPAFTGVEFGYGILAKVSVTVDQPGTYQYRDPYFGWTGTLVVE